MNKKLLAIIASIALPFCLHAEVKEAKDLSPEELIMIMEQKVDTVVKFKAGDVFPLYLDMKSPFFTLNTEETHLSITVTKDLYVCMREKNNPSFSLDGKDWKNFTEMFTGIINAGFGTKGDECLTCSLSAEIKERNS